MHNEYAQTATDFLARRSRLAFLNAQAALDALPRVVAIMGAELGWDTARRKQEIERTAAFLVSMGLFSAPEQAKALTASVGSLVGIGAGAGTGPSSDGIAKKVWTTITGGKRGRADAKSGPTGQTGRAVFSADELEALRHAFVERSSSSPSGSATLPVSALRDIVHGLPSYGAVRDSDITRALEETAFQNGFSIKGLTPIGESQNATKETAGAGLNYEDFLDVVASVKEVSLTPESVPVGHAERRRIPVERSGGGV